MGFLQELNHACSHQCLADAGRPGRCVVTPLARYLPRSPWHTTRGRCRGGADSRWRLRRGKQQREVGTGYFDLVNVAVSGAGAPTAAMAGSTEALQFQRSPRLVAAE